VKPDDVTTVLLVGGSSRTPLVAELVSSVLGRPVAVDAHPKYGVALGAAITAAHRAVGDSATGASAPIAAEAPRSGGPGALGVAGAAAAGAVAGGLAGGLHEQRSPDPFPGPRTPAGPIGDPEPVASAQPAIPAAPPAPEPAAGTSHPDPTPVGKHGSAAAQPTPTTEPGGESTWAQSTPAPTERGTAWAPPTSASADSATTTAHAGSAPGGAELPTGRSGPSGPDRTVPQRSALGAYGASAADQRTGRLDPTSTGRRTGPGDDVAHGGGLPPDGDEPRHGGGDGGGPSRRPVALVAGGILVVALLAAGAYLGLSGGDDGDDGGTATADPGADAGETSDTAPETTPPEPTTTSTTLPAGPYVQIDNVVLEGGRYRVNYQVFGYTPEIGDPGTLHVHFFPDTQPAATAGTNGTEGVDDWDVTDEASSFLTKYTPDGVAGATQMCSAVADHAHAIHTPEVTTGNCVDLPA
jgi:hypothetical protein